MCDGFLGDDQIYISKDRLANPDLLLYFSSMKIEVSKLKHHPKNKEIYTLSSIEELMDSISELGLLQPLVVDQQNQIISGNRRFESVKRFSIDNSIKAFYQMVEQVS